MPLNVNMENLREMHGDKAGEVFREIADLGGFGNVGTNQGEVDPNYKGGLDVWGVIENSNTAVSEQAKDRIAELAGVSRKKDVDSFKPTDSFHKMQPTGIANNREKEK